MAFSEYTDAFLTTLNGAEASDGAGRKLAIDDAIAKVLDAFRRIARGPNKVMFIGNGGSAGIAGHMAIDYAKNGGVRSLTFNDASSLTCLGNDLGYDQVFAKQVEMQAIKGDVLIAISSSGESKNILKAAEIARKMGCEVITLSGFAPGNTLRRSGDVNFYVSSGVYGFVETAHQAILHAILDAGMGWTKANAHTQPSAPIQ
jgi:D-sedoheptulose 7-phosphate isomerase